MISSGSASVGAAATGAAVGSDASSGTTSPFWYIRVGAAGTGASSANAGSTAAHKLPASKARRVVGLPHGRSVRPDAAERSAQSTRAVLITGDGGVARGDSLGGHQRMTIVFFAFVVY